MAARAAGDKERLRISCRPLRELAKYFALRLRVPLAKPRSTLGFMLTPASQVSKKAAAKLGWAIYGSSEP